MISGFAGHHPRLERDVWIAHNATVIGRIELGEASNIWYGTVMRGDVGAIKIGARTNVQDLSMIHMNGGESTIVGDDVTLGHRVILHGSTIADRVLVGMGAIVLDGAEIGSDVVIAAGTVIPPRMKVPTGVMVMGQPGKVVRDLKDEERMWIPKSAEKYVLAAQAHRALREDSDESSVG